MQNVVKHNKFQVVEDKEARSQYFNIVFIESLSYKRLIWDALLHKNTKQTKQARNKKFTHRQNGQHPQLLPYPYKNLMVDPLEMKKKSLRNEEKTQNKHTNTKNRIKDNIKLIFKGGVNCVCTLAFLIHNVDQFLTLKMQIFRIEFWLIRLKQLQMITGIKAFQLKKNV